MGTRRTAVRIGAAHAGCAVLDFVASRFTYRSREQWQEELDAGRFRLNDNTAVTAGTELAAGDRLVYLMPELAEPPVAGTFAILYEDTDLLAVDKPGNLPCHPGGRYFRHTLWALLQEQCGLARPMFVNRLDRETSGVVLVAKHRQAALHCARQFAERQVEKRYLTLVEGDFPEGERLAAGFLAPDPASAIRKKTRFFPAVAPASGTPCRTTFRRLHNANGLSLLEALPLTGRCHQIRATLLALGFPVVGDKLYGPDEQLFLRFCQDQLTAADHQRLRLPRQALHAASLTLAHPTSGQPITFTAPWPEDVGACFPEMGRG